MKNKRATSEISPAKGKAGLFFDNFLKISSRRQTSLSKVR
jgi:hypothetical protein